LSKIILGDKKLAEKAPKQIQPEEKSQTLTPIVLTFEYKNTGMHGFNDTILISFRTRKVISSKLRLSKSGRHGTRIYTLLPARYIMYEAYRSNLGNTYISIRVVQLKEDGTLETLNQWQLYERKEQKMQISQLPEKIREILMANKDNLPLFYYVMPE
jgi:hypothetical protein